MNRATNAIVRRVRRLTGRGGDSGSGGGAALMLLIIAVGLFMVLALVVDGGTRAQALDRANRIATEAARAGLQAAVPLDGNVDTSSVDPAVQQYLAAEHVTGTTSVINGNTVRVDVQLTVPTKVLGLINLNDIPVTGTGTADITYQ